MVNDGQSVSQKLLAALPADPFEQLQVAQKITSMAVVAGVNKLEAETSRFHEMLEEKERTIDSMQQRIDELERSLQDADLRLSQVLENQEKITDERNALARTVQKLRREISKLEMFKKNLLQSLQEDDDSAASQAEEIDFMSQPMYANSMPTAKDDDERSSPPRSSDHGEVYRSYMSNVASNLTTSNLDSDRHNSMVDGFPLKASAIITNSVNAHTPGTDTRSVRSPTNIVVQHSHSVLSDSVQTPRADGKEFFRLARNRLSYQQFSAFLSNIKELNAHRQSREETLTKAEQIFGPDNRDLYYAFDSLITRHTS